MNREQIYVEFRKKVESDDNYFTFGRYGIIEEILGWLQKSLGVHMLVCMRII